MLPKICSIPECGKPLRSRGWCNMHYKRYLAHGNPNINLNSPTSVESRFWPKVEKTDTCWNWVGSKARGYGQLRCADGLKKAHRISYELANGPIERGFEVDHRCHNRACVNPEHLRLVTHKQNNENHAGSRADSKSGIRGVTWHCGKWRATLGHNGVNIHVGRFSTIREAEAAVIAKRNELFTHNDIDRGKKQ